MGAVGHIASWFGNVSATVGMTGFTNIKGKMFSLTGIILASLAEEKMQSRQYRSARRRLLNSYQQSRLEKLQKKYLTKRRGKLDSQLMEKEIQKMMQQFKRDHQEYVRTFMGVVKQVVKAFEAANMKEAEIVNFYPELQLDLDAYIHRHPDKKIFPEKVTRTFRKKLDSVLADLTISLHRELDLMALEASGSSRPVMKVFPMYAKLRKAIAEARGVREVQRLGKDVTKYEDIQRAIIRQIGSSRSAASGLQQNFLILLLHYATLCERVFGSFKKIKSDALAIMEYMDRDIVKVERKLSYFLMFLQSDPTIQGDVEAIKTEFDTEYRRVKDYLVYEETRVITLRKRVEALESADVPDKIADILTMDEAAAEAASDAIFHRRTQHLVHREHLIPDYPLNR